MIANSLLQIDGINESAEKKIWAKGIESLAQFAKKNRYVPYAAGIKASLEALAQNDAVYFQNNLAPKEHWRLFKHFQEQACYIDIEATGFYKHDTITTISLFDGKNIKWYVNGENLEDFARDLAQYKLLITFHGGAFDLPFLRRILDIDTTQYGHIDLFLVLKSLGYRGSLKKSYATLGFARNNGLMAVNGNIAVILWHRYKKTRDKKYLEALLCYNIEDVLMLENLMITAYNKKLARLPIKIPHLLPKEKINNPFIPDPEILKEVKTLNAKLNPKKPSPPRKKPNPKN